MPRFYEAKSETRKSGTTYSISFKASDDSLIEVPVTKCVYDLIDELQREYWRLERRESRHCVHIEAIPERFIPQSSYQDDPEQELIREYEQRALRSLLGQIPEKQRRRFLMRYEDGLSSKEIAEVEGCTERSVQYSLMLAKSNLRDLLNEAQDL